MGHDIVVIGGSYGSFDSVARIVGMLPPGFPASIFIVIHIPVESPNSLPAIITRTARVQAFHALDGAAIETGRIYVAPPDHHLLLRDGDPRHMRVVRGPRVNRHRPAVDPLFRSAAAAFGSRVIGIVLSGYLDDGTAGLAAIKKYGGIAVVQCPDDALEPSMPQAALDNVKVDHCVPIAVMPDLLMKLFDVPAPQMPAPTPEMLRESFIEELDVDTLNDDRRYGAPSPYSCPECGGVLWEIQDGDMLRFRCRVGHAFSSQTVQAEQDRALETAMWTALKTLEESASLCRRLAADAASKNMRALTESYNGKVKKAEEQANLIRRALLKPATEKTLPVPPAREVREPDGEHAPAD